MIQIAPFDDSAWKAKLAAYKQTVIAQRPTLEAPQAVTPHTPYPYERTIHLTRHPMVKPPLQRLDLPQKAPIAPEIGVYWGIHQIVNKTRELRRLAAKAWADKWLDPFTYFDEAETPYTKAGGIDIDRAILMAWSVLRSIGRVETEALINLYDRALQANAKVIYLTPVPPETAVPANVITLPLVALSRHPRTCAWCGTKTSSGIRALCDQHHHRFIIDGNFRNSGTSHDEIARLILQADNQHRANVLTARLLQAA